MRPRREIISQGETALVTDPRGQIAPDSDQGLFVHETRVISRHEVRVGGRAPHAVMVGMVRQDQWRGCYLVPADDDGDENPHASAAREGLELVITRTVGEGLHEDLELVNHSGQVRQLTLSLQVDADFVGIDEAGLPSPRRGAIARTSGRDDGGVTWCWRMQARRKDPRDGRTYRFDRAIHLRASEGATGSRRGGVLRFRIRLEPRGTWHTCLSWQVMIEGEPLASPPCARDTHAHARRLAPPWLERATSFACRGDGELSGDVMRALSRSRSDLHALRLHRLDSAPDAWTVAAGVPAYLGPFGRDMLTAGWQSLMCGPEICTGGLQLMVRTQGQRHDDWRDEQPGRMLHEGRRDPAAALNERPTGRYYGSLTSSGLFPFAVAELWDWTGDRDRVGPLLEPAIKALQWMDRHAMQVPGPFYAVTTRSPKGLDNQTWKDSSESIVDTAGKVVRQPVATCEEQGIVYIGKMRLAQVLAAFGQTALARTMQQDAALLKERFLQHFWLPDHGHPAIALDPEGRPIESLGSNALRCLASGILPRDMALLTAERTFKPDMFSGWGIRTLSADHAAYNPYGYHVGTVWPVEHAAFAMGLWRYGLHERCEQLCRAHFELMSLCVGHRLPECISGHPRNQRHPFPAVYPAANAPQAWSASTPLVLLRALLGLRPWAHRGALWLDPHLPAWLPHLEVHGLRVGDAVVDLAFQRDGQGRTEHEVRRCVGTLRIERRASAVEDDALLGKSLQQHVG